MNRELLAWLLARIVYDPETGLIRLPNEDEQLDFQLAEEDERCGVNT